MKQIARWEAKGGKRWIALYKDEQGYTYKGDSQGGVLSYQENDANAIAKMEQPWGTGGAGAVTVLKSDFPSVTRVA